MAQSFKYTEPTIWALRKGARPDVQSEDTSNEVPSLYEHIYGYDPIRINRNRAEREKIQKGSAENPGLNILNPQTNFVVKAITSKDAPGA
jgi:hypothetical protein